MKIRKKKNTLIAIALVALTAVSMLATSGKLTEASGEVTTYNQKGYALKKYSTKNFKVLKNVSHPTAKAGGLKEP